MERPGRALGLDFGSRRIGLAVSDPEGRFAFPAGVLERRGLARDLAELQELIAERGIRRLVVGLPLHMDGRAGDMAEAARDFARRLEERTGLPVELLDERWTSLEAKRALRETGARPRRRKAAKRSGAAAQRAAGERSSVDAVAATLLLRTWLERGA